MKNCAFVEFKDEAQAVRAQAQLNRLRFLGKILAVERAKPFTPKTPLKDQNDISTATLPAKPAQLDSQTSHVRCFESRPLHTGAVRHEPIAPSLGIDYPCPPHLEYAYPPPDGNILTNIVNALIAVPRFYTQVLHLMNKMNLPAPFRPALPTPPLPPPPPEPVVRSHTEKDLSSDESELESSEEREGDEGRDTGTNEINKKKRKTLAEDVVEPKPTSLVPTERPMIKKQRPVLQIKIQSKGHPKETSAPKTIEVQQEEPVTEKNIDEKLQSVEPSTSRNAATREELLAGRMPSNELFALPMCKNYTRGIPTPVLYIKNLPKDATKEDLYYIFGAVFEDNIDFRSQLGVKLMQEGRMRGQAFIDFPSTSLAEDALNMVHGYVLKGKPMVVQFGRNPASTKTIG
ncbi:hypothetical protein KP509_20G078800 [Ceratopteris richardii]|nr:hypothetical protein KP509_20G078800 [Ceratopteris richardii]